MDEKIKAAYKKYFKDEYTFGELIIAINIIYMHHTGSELIKRT